MVGEPNGPHRFGRFAFRVLLMTQYEYVGPALLRRTLKGSVVRTFRGRVVRHRTTGALRFYVNRTSARKLPKDWPGSREWTDDFELTDIEWLGKAPADV
jgi:hypothetical protein